MRKTLFTRCLRSGDRCTRRVVGQPSKWPNAVPDNLNERRLVWFLGGRGVFFGVGDERDEARIAAE